MIARDRRRMRPDWVSLRKDGARKTKQLAHRTAQANSDARNLLLVSVTSVARKGLNMTKDVDVSDALHNLLALGRR